MWEFLDRNGFGFLILCALIMTPDCIRAIREVPHATPAANP